MTRKQPGDRLRIGSPSKVKVVIGRVADVISVLFQPAHEQIVRAKEETAHDLVAEGPRERTLHGAVGIGFLPSCAWPAVEACASPVVVRLIGCERQNHHKRRRSVCTHDERKGSRPPKRVGKPSKINAGKPSPADDEVVGYGPGTHEWSRQGRRAGRLVLRGNTAVLRDQPPTGTAVPPQTIDRDGHWGTLRRDE